MLLPLGVMARPAQFQTTTKQIWGNEVWAAHDQLGGNYGVLSESAGERKQAAELPKGVVMVGGRGAGKVVIGEEAQILVMEDTVKTGYMVSLKHMESSYLPKIEGQGLLAGLDVPAEAAKIRLALRLARYSDALKLIAKLDDGDFKQTLTDRIQKAAREKRRVLDVFFEEGKKWEAYRVASSFIRCFPKEKDASKVRSMLAKLKADRTVKDELAARKMYAQVSAKAAKMMLDKRVDLMKQALPGLIEKYPETVCASIMKKILESGEKLQNAK